MFLIKNLAICYPPYPWSFARIIYFLERWWVENIVGFSLGAAHFLYFTFTNWQQNRFLLSFLSLFSSHGYGKITTWLWKVRCSNVSTLNMDSIRLWPNNLVVFCCSHVSKVPIGLITDNNCVAMVFDVQSSNVVFRKVSFFCKFLWMEFFFQILICVKIKKPQNVIRE